MPKTEKPAKDKEKKKPAASAAAKTKTAEKKPKAAAKKAAPKAVEPKAVRKSPETVKTSSTAAKSVSTPSKPATPPQAPVHQTPLAATQAALASKSASPAPKPYSAPAAPHRPATPAAPAVSKPAVPPASGPGRTFAPQQPPQAPRPAAPARPAAPQPATIRPSAPQQNAARAYGSAPAVAAPEAKPVVPPAPKKMSLRSSIAVKELADKLGARTSDLIARLIKMGIFANINQSINYETAAKIVVDFGFVPEKADETAVAEAAPAQAKRDEAKLVARPPIVTFMGHVDHGKTSLLDAIRKTKVAAGESGGITQHIGAYEVFLPKGAVTFLDTPGHEAFTEMRSRGAKATDIVVLVVAADDGIMPQTEEAIDHAKAAEATIVVAINKIDLPGANIEKVKKELASRDLLPEDWGGKTITLGVSAKTGAGIDQLLEMLLLEAEVLELKANPQAPAEGVVIEAQLSKGSGPVATVLIQEGTLRVGDTVVCGEFYAKVRAMINDRGQRVREAAPAMPVEIAGLSGVPRAGDRFYAVENEVKAREILEEKKRKDQDKRAHVTLEDAYSDITAGKMNALKLIIKSDVQGSVEALRGTLLQIPTGEVQLQIIHAGIGNISKSDVMLAAASNAIIVGFHVDIVADADAAAKLEQVDVRLYEIIYDVKSAIEKAMSGMLAPEVKEVFIGAAEVRQLFKTSKFGIIAGSMVSKGKIVRNFQCRILRAGKKVHEGKISGLKRFKDDVREVQEGFECGITVSNFKDYVEGDKVEVYEIQTKERAA